MTYYRKFGMNTNHEITSKTILITGTSRGIGNHLASVFLNMGYKVIGVSRSNTTINNPNFQSIQIDISDLSQVSTLKNILGEREIIGLINNCGIHGPIGPMENSPIDQWIQTFNVNLFGHTLLSQMCIPSLRSNKGFIIFMSGGGSAFPRPNFSAYSVSKTGIVRLSETLAQELSPDILVYCVAPGPNRTSLLEEAIANGETVPEADIVDFEYASRLCSFLSKNKDPRYSGKFIHVKDNYIEWDDHTMAGDGYTLRRVKPV